MKDLANNAINILNDRSWWESKMRMAYRMRHDGLPRINKPFPTAADGHYPEVDMAIRRLKPFWVGQVTSGDKLCVFTSLKQQTEAISDAAADYFDFELNNHTEFLRKLRVAIDFMLLYGRGVLKVTVDPLDKYKIVFEAIDPMFILMPQEANGFEDADEFVHVRPMTIAEYKRLDDRYDKSPETIQKIRGNKDFQSLGVYEQDVRLREGIMFTRQERQTILFEHYTKTNGGWTVSTYCPMAPEIALRKPYGVPYKVDGKVSIPFFSFQMEVKDEGWYSPRGLGELLGPVERYLTKLWNEKADAMTFANRPLYTGEKEITNTANYRWQPGEYIPGNIRGVQQSAPPFSFDQEIMFVRTIGEQQSQSPDFGITRNESTGDKVERTATENNRISALQSAGSNDNANMFREDLTKVYRHVWGLICRFKERDFLYYASGETNTLPEQALHDKYLITPDGSPDGWNRIARFQQAVVTMQTFVGNPNVDMEFLTKRALQACDGRLALKAFIPTNMKGAEEYEDEVIEISAMLAPPPGRPSFPAAVKPSEDHATRLKADIDWLHACSVQRVPVDMMARQRVQEHMAQHFQFLKQQNPQAARELQMMLQQMEQAGMQPQQQMPGNVAPMPGQSQQAPMPAMNV